LLIKIHFACNYAQQKEKRNCSLLRKIKIILLAKFNREKELEKFIQQKNQKNGTENG
jgi:hypothetical protein